MNAIAIAIGAGSYAPFAPNRLANLAAWYRLGLGITIATGVSRWADQSGNGNDLIQNTGGNQPAKQGDGSILFDGVSQFLKGTFTLNQPTTVYLRMKQVTWTVSGMRIADGAVGTNGGAIVQESVSPNFDLFAGNTTPQNTNLALNTYASVVAVFNGATSVTQVDGNAAVTGNAGTNNMGGFALGSSGVGGNNSNIQVKEVVIYSAAHDAATRARVIAYLATL